MVLITFSPGTKIKSADENANWQNFSDHGRNITLEWLFAGSLTTQTSKDYKSLPDNVLFSRVDIIVDTAPTGANIIVDIERSIDNGASWTTIFTGGTNRPQIAAGAKVGNTTTIDVPTGVENSHLYRAKISQVGSTIAGADLSIFLKGTYTLD